MDKWVKRLLILFVCLFAIKAIFSFFVYAPSAFSDEYTYIKMAQNFWEEGSFNVNSVPTHQYLPLYPMAISIAHAFKDMQHVYLAVKIINALLSSLIIFPMFFLSKQFLEEKNAFYVGLISSVIPISFAFSSLAMSENLFMPLFVLAVYCIYNAFSRNKIKWDIAAGISVGLCMLTKIQGGILILGMVVLIVYKIIKKDYSVIWGKALMVIISLLVFMPWLIHNFLIFGVSLNSAIGGYSYAASQNTAPIIWFAGWILLYLAYIITASGIIFPALSLNAIKDNKFRMLGILIFTLAAGLIIISARHSYSLYSLYGYSRIIGRYVEFIVPFIVLLGAIGMQNAEPKQSKFEWIIIGILSLISVYLLKYTLMPINNMSLAWMGIISYSKAVSGILPYLLSAFIILAIMLICYKKHINSKKLYMYMILFFAALSLINATAIGYNSYQFWYKSDMIQTGIWINENITSNIVIILDKDDECPIIKTQQCLYEHMADESITSVPNVFFKNPILIGDANSIGKGGYLISTKTLDLKKIKTVGLFNIYSAKTI